MRHEVIFINDQGWSYRECGMTQMGLCIYRMQRIFGPLSSKIRVILTGRPIVGSKEVRFDRKVSNNTLYICVAGKRECIVNDTANFIQKNNLLGKRCYVKVENIS